MSATLYVLVALSVVLTATQVDAITPLKVGSPATVPSLNVTQYLGRWFEVYQDWFDNVTFQNNSYCATAVYGPNPSDPAHPVTVRNWERQYNTSGYTREIFGYAFYPNASIPGQLAVVLEGAPTKVAAPYWVYALGPVVNDQYEWALVSDPYMLSLFILARDVDRFFSKYNSDVLVTAALLGFDSFVDEPIPLPQTNCTYIW